MHSDPPSSDCAFRTNVFLLGIHGCVTAILAIGLSSLAMFGDAGIPKSAELKIYATLIVLVTIWFFLAPRWKAALERPQPRYWNYLAVYFPILALMNVLQDFFAARLIVLFLGAVAGFFIWRGEPGNAPAPTNPASLHGIAAGIITAILLTTFFSIGNSFNLVSPVTPIALIGWWLILRYGRLPASNVIVSLIVILLLALLFAFVRIGFMDPEHYAYFMGPIIEAFHGRLPLADVAPQYGAGLTAILAGYFRLIGTVSNGGLIHLLRILTFVQFVLVFVLAWSLTKSRLLALCALITTLIFVFCSQGDNYFAFPSTGMLRFGFPLIVALIYCITDPLLQKRLRPHLLGILAALASFWSFEVMVYTVPAILIAEWMGKRLLRFLPFLLIYTFMIWGGYVLIVILSGHTPDLTQYLEYPLLFQSGYGQIPLIRETTLWWLFPVIGLWGVATTLFDEQTDERLAILSVSALAMFTYFVGRAHPNNLHHIAIPFILLLFVLFSRMHNLKWRNALLVLVLTLMTTLNLSFFAHRTMLQSMWILAGASISEARGTLFHPVYDNCEYFTGFTQYIKNNQLALIDPELISYNVDACIGTSNAFAMNPLDETSISPRAIRRALARARLLPPQPVLVAVNPPEESRQQALIDQLLNELVLSKKFKTVTLAGRTYKVYDGQGKGMVR